MKKMYLTLTAIAIMSSVMMVGGCKSKEVVAPVEETVIETVVDTTAVETTASVFVWNETEFGTAQERIILKSVKMYLEPRLDAEVSHLTQEDVNYWFMGYVNDGEWYVIKEFLEEDQVYYVPASEFPELSVEKTNDVEETSEAIKETEASTEAFMESVAETTKDSNYIAETVTSTRASVESTKAAETKAETKAQPSTTAATKAPAETQAPTVAPTVAPTEAPTVAQTAASSSMEDYLKSIGMTPVTGDDGQTQSSNGGMSEWHNDNVSMN